MYFFSGVIEIKKWFNVFRGKSGTHKCIVKVNTDVDIMVRKFFPTGVFY